MVMVEETSLEVGDDSTSKGEEVNYDTNNVNSKGVVESIEDERDPRLEKNLNSNGGY